MIEWQTTQNTTLLEALMQEFPDQSKRTLRHWLQYERVWVNGMCMKNANVQLKIDDWVQIKEWEKRISTSISILYEDDEVIVIDKPAGLLSVADEKNLKENAFAMVKRRFPDAWVLHRLDGKTQGVLMFAKGREAGLKYKEMIEKKEVRRRYLAICHGHFSQEQGEWITRLWEDKTGHVHVLEANDTKPKSCEAITYWRLLQDSPTLNLLEFELYTGKKHQIRTQAAHYAHPILGDERYGSKDYKTMQLLAWQLAWPTQKGWKEVQSNFVNPFEQTWQKLRKKSLSQSSE